MEAENATVQRAKGKLAPQTDLERHVANWVRERVIDAGYDDESHVLGELLQHGCQSGLVNHLIYYVDTVAFFRKHRVEISRMLAGNIRECGMQPGELFGRMGWDHEDPLAVDTHNQNILAWFGFEEAARNLADRAELDV